MTLLQQIFIIIIIVIHLYIVYLEIFLWTTPKGMKTFAVKSKEFAEETKVMAANQGLYNGFLAAGLIWALVCEKTDVALFFAICVFVAGIFGAISTKMLKILFIQSIPATLAILSILI